MEVMKSKMMEALKARALKARKPMTDEEKAKIRERFRNSEFFKIIKSAQEKKTNEKKED